MSEFYNPSGFESYDGVYSTEFQEPSDPTTLAEIASHNETNWQEMRTHLPERLARDFGYGPDQIDDFMTTVPEERQEPLLRAAVVRQAPVPGVTHCPPTPPHPHFHIFGGEVLDVASSAKTTHFADIQERQQGEQV